MCMNEETAGASASRDGPILKKVTPFVFGALVLTLLVVGIATVGADDAYATTTADGWDYELTDAGDFTLNKSGTDTSSVPWGDDKAKIKTITICAAVEKLPNNTFNGCTSVTSVVFADNCKVKEIPNNAFSGCSKITSFTFGAGSVVEKINNNAFYNCGDSEVGFDFTLPSSVKFIGQSSFQYTKVTSFTIGADSNLEEIGWNAFQDCGKADTKLTLVIPEKVTTFGWYMFNSRSITEIVVNCEIKTSIFQESYYLEDVTVGSNTTVIPGNLFSYCNKLKSVTFEGNVTEIGYNAFYNCTSLETLSIGCHLHYHW